MTQDRERLESLFDAARELADPAERKAFLDAQCAQDEPLRSRLEGLLSAEGEAERFFADCAPALALPAKDGLQEKAADSATAARLDATVDQPLGTRISHYKVLEKIGEGGCGVVYVAEQEEPIRRRVALKLIKPGMDTKQVVARFDAERQALAIMDHPNIAKVLDAGATEQGRPFFVMELVQGVRITDYADQNHLDTNRRLELFIQVCNAVQHAHQKGIIHRDLKPSNILVTLHDGVPVPKIIDFGIAKALQGGLTDWTVSTELNQFIGTPAYASPEQAEMNALDVDTRSDIYSLGVLLYELLTGRTPFEAKDLPVLGLEAIRRRIREVEPPRPSVRLSTLAGADLAEAARARGTEPPRLLSLIRGDLDWIVMKCLEKERGRRYETTEALSMDLRRLLSNEPVVARPPSRVYRLKKLTQRHKALFLGGALLLLALVAGLSVTSWALVRERAARAVAEARRQDAERARADERQQRLRAQAEELTARRFEYDSDMNLVQQALNANNIGRARELLNRNIPKPGEVDLRGWEWRYLWKRCQSDALFTLCHKQVSVMAVALEPNQRIAVIRDASGATETWDLKTRKRTAAWGGAGYGRALAVSDAANLIAYGAVNPSGKPVIELRHPASTAPVAELQQAGYPMALDFSPDGKQLAIFSDTPGVQVVDLKTHRNTLLVPSPGNGGAYKGVVLFSPNGEWLAIGGIDGTIRLLKLPGFTQAWRVRAFPDGISALAFSADAKLLASGSGYSENNIKLWHVASGTSAGELAGHNSWITSLAFAPKGDTLASASGDQTIRLWNAATRRQLGVLRGHESEIHSVVFGKNGRTLLSGSKDGAVCVWDANRRDSGKPYSIAPTPVRFLKFLPGSKTFLSLDRDGSLGRWSTKTMRETGKITGLGRGNVGFAISDDGRLLAVGDAHGRLKLWDLNANREVTNFFPELQQTLHGNAHPFQSVPIAPARFLANDKQLLIVDGHTVAHILECDDWRELSHWQIPPGVTTAGMSPDNRILSVGYGNGMVRLFNVADGRQLAYFQAHRNYVTATGFTPDGKLFATASEGGLAKLWDPKTFSLLAVLRGHLLGVHSVAASPDSQRLVTGSDSNEAIKIWDRTTHQELLNLAGEGSQFDHTYFSPDGNLLVSVNIAGVVHYWRAPSMAEINAAEAAHTIHGNQTAEPAHGELNHSE